MKLPKVLITGPIAPPFGGVSIHISRLVELLNESVEFDFVDESREIKNSYFNIRNFKFLLYLKKVNHTNYLFINSGKNSLRIFHILVGKIFRKNVVLIIHSFSSKYPAFIRFILGFIYRLPNVIIVVNPQIKLKLFLPGNKTIIKEAFIPPQMLKEPELPPKINEIILQKIKENKKIICANASRLEIYNNVDLYGLDLCIQVSKKLLENKIKFFFIFVVSTLEKNSNRFYENKELINKLNLQNNFLLINEKLSFVKLMEKSDIVIRPTNSDGDSVTVREALLLNKLVLASDVVKRPEGVHLFKNRNIIDLQNKLELLVRGKNNLMKSSVDRISEIRANYKHFYISLIKE